MGSNENYLKIALELAKENVNQNGGPFGALVVWNNKIIGKSANKVTRFNDPTAHAEILAIRDACSYLGNYMLNECVLYSSCEPCPMCLGAIFWARIPRVYYAASRGQAANAGFDDQALYDEITGKAGAIELIHQKMDETMAPFTEWDRKADKKLY